MILKISLPVLTEAVILGEREEGGSGGKPEACCSLGQKSAIGSGQGEGRKQVLG